MSNNSKLYSYILVGDNGGAPCVENDCLTIAICKPVIRKNANVGDMVVGISSYKLGKKKKIIFIAVITKMIPMQEYASFRRPDSIYTSDLKMRPNAFHTNCHSNTDLKGKNVIMSTDFIYFGKNNIDVQSHLSGIIPGRGHQSNKNRPFKQKLLNLFTKEKRNGVGKIGDYTGNKSKCSKKCNKCD